MAKSVITIWLISAACFGVIKSVEKCNDVKDKVINYEKCETKMIYHLNSFIIECWKNLTGNLKLYVTFSGVLSMNSSSHSTGCLRLIRAQLKTVSEIYEKSQLLSIENEEETSVIYRFQCDFHYNFNDSVGVVSYDRKCFKNATSLNKKHDLSNETVFNCVDFVKAIDFIAKSKKRWTDEGYLWKILKLSDTFSLTEFNVSIENFVLEMKYFSLKKLDLQKLSNLGIKQLDLSNNFIERIENDNFPQILSLQILDLENCELFEIEAKAFDSIPNLKRLNLAGNLLKKLPHAFSQLKHLQTLRLGNNNNYGLFSNVGFRINSAIENLSNLKYIDFSKMNLILNETEIKLKNVESFDLSQSRIIYYDKPLMKRPFPFHIPNVNHLILSNSPTFAGNMFTFPKWTRLRTLDLSHNYIYNISTHIEKFNHFPNLFALNLAHNNVQNISIFPILNNIQHSISINLSHNLIRTWNETKWNQNISKLLTIDLSNNIISLINSAMLSDFKILDKVYLYRNPFDCSNCVVEPFYRWLLQTQNSMPYLCVYPKEVANTLITNLKFDPESCKVKPFNWLMKALLPVLIIIVLSALIFYVSFKYKWHIQYLLHLIRARFNARRNNSDINLTTLWRYDAFVSYCSADCKWVVEQLIVHLEQEEPRLHLCVHERDFVIGGTIIDNVIDCIDYSRKSLFLISKRFIRSNWCQWELQMAQHKLFEDGSDVLVLVLLEDLEGQSIPRTLQKLMATRTYLIWPETDSIPERKLFWSRLKQCIGRCHCLQGQNDVANENNFF